MFDIVLVEAEGEENIGSIARIIMNFSLDRLILIAPKANHLSENSLNYAVHAKEILKNALVYDRLYDYLSGSDISIAFTKRIGQFRKKDLISYEIGEFLKDYKDKRVSLIFGNEKYGLKSEDIDLCDLICYIPASIKFPSINLAQSVGIISYEIYKNILYNKTTENSNLAERKEVEEILNKIISFLNELNYFKNTPETRLKNYLKKLLFRIKPDKNDAVILNNLFTRVNGIVKRILK
ncbi:MAG: RNA methyltransferase [Brevinematia bacterium]